MKTVYNLPSELPEPPEAPAGKRWEYRGVEWWSKKECEFAYFYNNHWIISEDAAVGGRGHYLEAAPLRTFNVTVPEGYEYFGRGPLLGDVEDALFLDNAIEWWGVLTLDCKDDLALKIGSKTHFDNIVNVAKIEPVKSERDQLHESYTEEPLPDLELAINHIKALLNNEGLDEARQFIQSFEPPFDWDKLWSDVASWNSWIACDEDGKWYSYIEEPPQRDLCWGSDSCSIIPESYWPPKPLDWKTSLVERPKK